MLWLTQLAQRKDFIKAHWTAKIIDWKIPWHIFHARRLTVMLVSAAHLCKARGLESSYLWHHLPVSCWSTQHGQGWSSPDLCKLVHGQAFPCPFLISSISVHDFDNELSITQTELPPLFKHAMIYRPCWWKLQELIRAYTLCILYLDLSYVLLRFCDNVFVNCE